MTAVITRQSNKQSSQSPELIEAARVLAEKIDSQVIDLFIVAGSGFRDALPDVAIQARLPMRDIPNLPSPSVAGHGSELIYGLAHNRRVLIATGRVHMYEGYSPTEVVFAIRLVSLLGCRAVILTNAAGSVDRTYSPGTLMLLRDQINLTGKNCETTTPGIQAPFTDMTDAYDAPWRERVQALCGESSKTLTGVYAGLTGPSYETRAEATMLATLGANVVGMSTVQECIASRTLAMNVLGVSMITNMAGGLDGPVRHQDVLAIANAKIPDMKKLLDAAVRASPTGVRANAD